MQLKVRRSFHGHQGNFTEDRVDQASLRPVTQINGLVHRRMIRGSHKEKVIGAEAKNFQNRRLKRGYFLVQVPGDDLIQKISLAENAFEDLRVKALILLVRERTGCS